MRTRLVALLTALCGAGLVACQTAPSPATSVESRLAAQNAIFEAEYEFDLKMHPETATQYGDYRYNDRLNDYSLKAVKTIHSAELDFVARLKAIPTGGFPEQDLLSHQAMLQTLQQHLDDYAFKQYEMPVSQVDGPQLELADLPSRFRSIRCRHTRITSRACTRFRGRSPRPRKCCEPACAIN